ncbi:O-Antigen ligase [compost metagenome]
MVIAASYGVRLAAGPLSVQSTLEAIRLWAFLGGFGAVSASLAAISLRGRRALEAGWLLIGSLLTLTALAAVYGVLPLPGAILRTADPAVSATGARLGGLLQYPNAFGAVMAAFLLERLMRLARMERAAFTREGGWRGQRAGALALLFALGLLLSESRGALAAALAGWAAGLALLRGPERRRYARHSAVFAGAAAVLARGLAAAQLAPAPGPGALALAAGLAAALLASALAAGALPRSRPPAAGLRRAACACGGAALLLAAPLAALPASAGFLGRGFRPETASARAAMYADAAALLRRSPWLGQGGDTWRHAFRSIQSLPYVGSEVHSAYLDLALDLGLIGLAFALLWLGALAIPLLRARSALLPPYLALLLHSAVDFDFSYGLVWLLLLSAAAIGIAEAREDRLRFPPGPTLASGGPLPDAAWFLPWLVRGAFAVVAAMLLLLSVSGYREAESQRLHRQALALPPQAKREAAELLQRSLALSPYRTAARLALAERSAPQEVASLLRAGLRYEPERSELWLALGRALAREGDPAAAAPLRRSVELDRFDRVKQTTALRELSQLAQSLRASDHLRLAEAAASTGADLYADYSRLAEAIAGAPALRNDRAFLLTAEAMELGRQLQQQSHPLTRNALK